MMLTPIDLAENPRGSMDAAVAALVASQTVVLPTDTIYGLAARAADAVAVGRLFELKGRAETKAIAILVAEPLDLIESDLANPQAPLHPMAMELIERHWPGPLTVVLARSPSFEADLGGNPATVGVRCPRHDFVRALAQRVGPLATTSANRAGEPTAITAALAAGSLLGDVGAVIDGGELDAVASTVVDLSGQTPAVLREGAIGRDQLW